MTVVLDAIICVTMCRAFTASISMDLPRKYVNIPARQCVPAPSGCDDIGAALAPITFGTCEHMLFDNALLHPLKRFSFRPVDPALVQRRSNSPKPLVVLS